MTDYKTAVDIANRALQHVGSWRITSFSDNTKEASETAFCYDKLRKAELRRNTWKFSTRRTVLRPLDTTTLMITPQAWSATAGYSWGAIVSDTNGDLWQTDKDFSVGSQPGSGADWDRYFGPMTATPYDSTQAYYVGELVYVVRNTNRVEVYQSLESSNADDPRVALTWSATATYYVGQEVFYNGFYYMSLINANINQTPGTYNMWNVGTHYAQNATVFSLIDGHVYTCLAAAGDTGHEPSSNSGTIWNDTGVVCPWTPSFIGTIGSNKWQKIPVTFRGLNISWPVGSGPARDSATRNCFMLPAGHVRKAPQNPKLGSTHYLGAPVNNMYSDWEMDGQFIVSRDISPIIYRFIADVTDVTKFDPMFCEGLACRVGMEVCEPLTQSTEKLTNLGSIYNKFMTEARTVNSIEVGSEEPPEDDYITCRI